MTWDRDLRALERAVSAVNAEYDAFLYGTAAHPPMESRRNVERLIRILSSAEPDSAGERFRFAALQGRWTALGERWERLQAEKEAGRRPGLYGHFQPRRTTDLEVQASSPNAAASGPVDLPREPSPASTQSAAEEPPPDPRRDLYDKYVAAKLARGETAEGFDFERFADSLEREANRLRDRFEGADVEFDVAERDGRVKLVARKKT
jgi:hypothetical protein